MTSTIAPPTWPTLHFVALTVVDLEASADWYERLFGLHRAMGGEHETFTATVLTDDAGTVLLPLCQHRDNTNESFSETRTGLDHVSFRLPDRAALVAWQQRLVDHGVLPAAAADRPFTQSPIADTPHGSILVFRDPDNIQLELTSPPEPAPSPV